MCLAGSPPTCCTSVQPILQDWNTYIPATVGAENWNYAGSQGCYTSYRGCYLVKRCYKDAIYRSVTVIQSKALIIPALVKVELSNAKQCNNLT